jgi:hypothetical protein
MADEQENLRHDSVGAWAKRLYFAARSVMDSVLRPYGLGSTQWYSWPAKDRPCSAPDREGTLSGVVATLVRKGLVDQTPGSEDQRQWMLRSTRLGTKLWKELPDPIDLILAVAFDGADPAELAIARRVLQDATQRLNEQISGGNQA